VLCAGCGELMAAGSKRGRPARYHDATCRQRGRRARLATYHDAALNTLASLETAVSELRHAILTNRDTTDAHGRIAAAAAELADQLEPVSHCATSSPAAGTPVTKPVTISNPAPEPDSTENAVTEQPEPNTADATCTPAVKTVDMRDSIGPGWTLVQHDGDAEASIWHVHHNGRTVGSVHRSYDLSANAGGWEARTADYHLVCAVGTLAASRRHDRLWRTRNSAAAGIAFHTTRHSVT
jgi:hypothetical protein